MSIRFRLLTEADVRSVLTMEDLVDTMASALKRFSAGQVEQPVRLMLRANGDDGLFATMPAFVRGGGTGGAAALGAKLVTVFGANHARGLPSHLASIVLLDPDSGALLALMDGRYITEARTAAVSAVSSRLLARPTAASLAIIGTGVQAQSHLEALSLVHNLRAVNIWSPNPDHRQTFVRRLSDARGTYVRRTSDVGGTYVGRTSDVGRTDVGREPDVRLTAVGHPGEAAVGADVIVLVTSSPTPVVENGWVKPGAHVISVGACLPTQREMDPDLVARARLFVDSRKAALVESGDVVLGMKEGRFGPDHIVAEIGDLLNGAVGRRTDGEVTVFKSLGMAVEDVTAAALAYQRAIEKGVGTELAL